MLRKFAGKDRTLAVSTSCYKSYRLLGGPTFSAEEDDAAPALLIPLILFANWVYTKMAKRKMFAHCT